MALTKIKYGVLGDQFTTSTALTPAADVDMDFTAAQVFTMTSSIAVDINFTNAQIGDTKDLIVTDSGGYFHLFTFDITTNTITTIAGTYSKHCKCRKTLYKIVCIAPNTFFLINITKYIKYESKKILMVVFVLGGGLPKNL